MNSKDIGLIIKRKRKELNLTQEYLALLSNTGTRFIIDLEKGKPTLQLEKVLSVLSVLKLKIEVTDND
ncbi:helix-turn-helix domain-containing protein [Haploplasma axanthum]|nr:helix-turn-helix domain-containing protein [Haploplasma axanthum]